MNVASLSGLEFIQISFQFGLNDADRIPAHFAEMVVLGLRGY